MSVVGERRTHTGKRCFACGYRMDADRVWGPPGKTDALRKDSWLCSLCGMDWNVGSSERPRWDAAYWGRLIRLPNDSAHKDEP